MPEASILLSFIGTGSAITDRGRYPSGIVIDRDIMVDAPPQCVSHLRKMEILPENLTYILITHFHPDHILGLVMLAQEWLVMHNRTKPAILIGPPGLEKFTVNLLEAAFDPGKYDYNEVFKFFELPGEAQTVEIEGLALETVPMKHSSFDLGYKIHRQGTVIAVSGDTGFCGGVFTLMEGSDTIIMEMTTVQQPFENHLNMLEHLPAILKRLQPGQQLFLYHLAYEDEDIYRQLRESNHPAVGEILAALEKGQIILAGDMQEYRLPVK